MRQPSLFLSASWKHSGDNLSASSWGRILIMIIMRGFRVFNSVEDPLIPLSDPAPFSLISPSRLYSLPLFRPVPLILPITTVNFSLPNYSPFPSTCHVFNAFAAQLGSSFRSLSLVTNQHVGVCACCSKIWSRKRFQTSLQALPAARDFRCS